MTSINTESYSIHFNTKCYTEINNYLKSEDFSKIFVLVDSNSHALCLPLFLEQISTSLDIGIIEIETGEQHKNIETCMGVWNTLSDLGCDRKSLMINIGGGVVTDLGGFVASTFKRGIRYINVPTTLLAMVDASVGGKTGIDLGSIKNQIGVINSSEMVLIDTNYLNTLPQNQMKSGLAEMLKHGLIHSQSYWNEFLDLSKLNLTDLDRLIYESVLIKYEIVTKDPKEQHLRKTLNFGHTLGHAIESYFLEQPHKQELLHGEAVAIGMILACHISHHIFNFPEDQLKEVSETIISIFSKIEIATEDYQPIIDLLIFDKKNEHGKILFVLLDNIASTKINIEVENELIKASFEYYNNL
ncbi:MAG: 3-dehydroquinate synthase [Bacteroidetes bacterium MedPE-SWsnd-G2]|nr:MAG: 3-dehydroquinate synthase [Bacteroidetes bacterium MedPE-SWsnd-G2]